MRTTSPFNQIYIWVSKETIPLICEFTVMHNTNLRSKGSSTVRLKFEEGAEWSDAMVWHTISSRFVRGSLRRIARRIERESRKWRVIVRWKHNLRISGGWAWRAKVERDVHASCTEAVAGRNSRCSPSRTSCTSSCSSHQPLSPFALTLIIFCEVILLYDIV